VQVAQGLVLNGIDDLESHPKYLARVGTNQQVEAQYRPGAAKVSADGRRLGGGTCDVIAPIVITQAKYPSAATRAYIHHSE
jgi:hypothetical protein